MILAVMNQAWLILFTVFNLAFDVHREDGKPMQMMDWLIKVGVDGLLAALAMFAIAALVAA